MILNNIDTRKETNVMSKNYVKIWENHHGTKLAKDKEIHHIDGNRHNNDPSNLLDVTIEQHLHIHEKQKDYGAVQAILMRMNRTDQQNQLIKEIASKHQKQLLVKGQHNFQKISKQRKSEISKQVALKTVEMKIGIHAINSDPILCKENAKRARKNVKRETELRMMEAWHDKVRNSKWWVNPEGKRRRSKDKPEGDWKEGMNYES